MTDEFAVTTVRSWRQRFVEDGLAKLGEVRAGQGRKPSITDEQVEEIVRLTLHEKPEGHRTGAVARWRAGRV